MLIINLHSYSNAKNRYKLCRKGLKRCEYQCDCGDLFGSQTLHPSNRNSMHYGIWYFVKVWGPKIGRFYQGYPC